MIDMEKRLRRTFSSLAGNESLADGVDEDAAADMLKWGEALAEQFVRKTSEMEDELAEGFLAPYLRALRMMLRATGQWVTGKYADSSSRIQLRDKILENFRVILGDNGRSPSPEQLDELLNQADDKSQTPAQLISKLRAMLEEYSDGGKHAKT